MSVTLPGSILSTVGPTASTTSGSTLPSILPSFAWINFPSTINTCSSVTLSWQYAGPQETLQFLLISNAFSHTLAASLRKRAGNTTTLATNIDAHAVSWTWSQVNFTADRYVMEAYGTGVDAASSTFTIVNGADTSCLAAAIPVTSTATSPKPSDSTTPLATASVRKTANAGVIAGGAVAGAVVLIIALLWYRVWGRRRKEYLTCSRYQTEATHHDSPSPCVAPAAPAPPLTEKGTDGTDRLDNVVVVDSPPSPNHRPPSFLLSDPSAPAPPYPSHTTAHDQGAGSIMDVSTIGSRSSAALSDATSTTGLMRAFSSSCPPSYATRPSRPPSYTTDKTRSATSPSSERFSYASSS